MPEFKTYVIMGVFSADIVKICLINVNPDFGSEYMGN
jgi:hypothetical protein